MFLSNAQFNQTRRFKLRKLSFFSDFPRFSSQYVKIPLILIEIQ